MKTTITIEVTDDGRPLLNGEVLEVAPLREHTPERLKRAGALMDLRSALAD